MKICQYCQRQRCRHVELEHFWQAFASRGFVSDSCAFLLLFLLLFLPESNVRINGNVMCDWLKATALRAKLAKKEKKRQKKLAKLEKVKDEPEAVEMTPVSEKKRKKERKSELETEVMTPEIKLEEDDMTVKSSEKKKKKRKLSDVVKVEDTVDEDLPSTKKKRKDKVHDS